MRPRVVIADSSAEQLTINRDLPSSPSSLIAFWIQFRPGNQLHHIRLEYDRLQWQPLGHTMVHAVPFHSVRSYRCTKRVLNLCRWAELNVFVALFLVYWVLAPILYCESLWYEH